jgi:hypothetical protein
VRAPRSRAEQWFFHVCRTGGRREVRLPRYASLWRRTFALRLWTAQRLAALAMLPSAAAWAERVPAPRLLALAARLSGK